jgi:hypothetical protein
MPVHVLVQKTLEIAVFIKKGIGERNERRLERPDIVDRARICVYDRSAAVLDQVGHHAI